jgi:hypothetical protein
MCVNFQNGSCNFGPRCAFAHGAYELRPAEMGGAGSAAVPSSAVPPPPSYNEFTSSSPPRSPRGSSPVVQGAPAKFSSTLSPTALRTPADSAGGSRGPRGNDTQPPPPSYDEFALVASPTTLSPRGSGTPVAQGAPKFPSGPSAAPISPARVHSSPTSETPVTPSRFRHDPYSPTQSRVICDPFPPSS